jgi:general secretion pathway protein A
MAAHAKGIRVVVAVDEAQNMPEQTLEGLRMLSNLETSSEKLLQIVLVGQPELERILAKFSLRQLAQRVAVRARIMPLTTKQMRQYIEWRVQTAGRSADSPLFTRPALWYLAATARGIPRRANILCDNALINGYGHGTKRVTLRVSLEARYSLGRQHRSRSMGRGAAAAAIAVIAIGSGFRIAFPNGKTAAPQSVPQFAQIAPSKTIPPPPPAPTARVLSVSTSSASSSPSPTSALPASQPQPLPQPGLQQQPGRAERVRVAVARMATSPSNPGSALLDRVDRATSPIRPRHWLVRSGETLRGICLETFYSCGPRELRAIRLANPRIGPGMRIRAGEIITLPAVQTSAALARSN